MKKLEMQEFCAALTILSLEIGQTNSAAVVMMQSRKLALVAFKISNSINSGIVFVHHQSTRAHALLACL